MGVDKMILGTLHILLFVFLIDGIGLFYAIEDKPNIVQGKG
jgi:hypothetical protein